MKSNRTFLKLSSKLVTCKELSILKSKTKHIQSKLCNLDYEKLCLDIRSNAKRMYNINHFRYNKHHLYNNQYIDENNRVAIGTTSDVINVYEVDVEYNKIFFKVRIYEVKERNKDYIKEFYSRIVS